MGLRSLFKKRRLATASIIPPNQPEPQSPLTPERLTDLQDAWADLAEAAKVSGAKANSFHACSRSSRPWQEDPAAVRSMAALLRSLPAEGLSEDSEPAE